MSDAGAAGRTAHLVSRLERFERVESTQDIVRGWLEGGLPEVCIAVADRQAAGRGRLERSWRDASGRTLLLSAGFRPSDLSLAQAWQLPAVASLAMLEAITSLPGLGGAPLALKWPNDIVAREGGRVRKVGGVLTEAMPEGDRLGSAIVGLGINVDWAAGDFPADLAVSMWSLREVAGGGPVDREALLAVWLETLAPRYAALRGGRFDGPRWAAAQVTTGALVEIDTGRETIRGTGAGVDLVDGALRVRSANGVTRSFRHGDVVRCLVGAPGRSL